MIFFYFDYNGISLKVYMLSKQIMISNECMVLLSMYDVLLLKHKS